MKSLQVVKKEIFSILQSNNQLSLIWMFAVLGAIDDVYRAFRFAISDCVRGQKRIEKSFNEAIVVTHTQGIERQHIETVFVSNL